jgi:FAD:protein FMN transferase
MARSFGLRQASARWWSMLAVLTAAIAYVTFVREPGAPAGTALEGSTMGTTYRVVVSTFLPSRAATELQQSIERRLAELEGRLSTYDARSELSRFNQHRSTDPFPASDDLLEVVRVALDVARASEGAFDVTIAPLVELWGFGPSGPVAEPPPDAAVARELERTGYEQLTIDGGALRKRHPELTVDLSGVAKGYAVDGIAALLDARGLPGYLVEIGGEVRVQGQSARGSPYRVGIEDPLAEGRGVRLAVNLESGALATSGNYRNFFERGGVRYGHTLDPVTGRPAVSPLLSASVWHPRCATADAWATALLVAGPDRARKLAEAHGLEVVLLVATPGGGILEHLTPGITRRRVDTSAPRAQK